MKIMRNTKKLVPLKKILLEIKKITFRGFGQFFASPDIAALCQRHWLTAAIATYFGGNYSQEQYETLTTFVHLLHSKIRSIEENKIDKEFFNTQNGKRIIGKIFRGILRDNRIEKIEAMANLTVNLFVKSKLNFDEKEVYVDILDSLNSLQLSILQRAILEIKSRKVNQHRGFGWEKLAKEYEQKGITGALLLQSIRALESNGLVNKNDATIIDEDRTHFVTIFGEQFYSFISEPVTSNIYL